MRYRDLLPDRWGGTFVASHITIPDGGPVPDYVHFHKVRFQVIFVKSGWVRLVYEDQGEPFVMVAGDCVLQPPQIRHRVLESSPGLEVIEIGTPALHDTIADWSLELPNGRGDTSRDWSGQHFVRHIAAEAPYKEWRRPGWEYRDTGIGDATGGLAGVRVARLDDRVRRAGRVRHRVRDAGRAPRRGDVRDRSRPRRRLRDSSSVAIPGGVAYRLVDPTPDCELLDVTCPPTSDYTCRRRNPSSRNAAAEPDRSSASSCGRVSGGAERARSRSRRRPAARRPRADIQVWLAAEQSPGEPPRLTRTSWLGDRHRRHVEVFGPQPGDRRTTRRRYRPAMTDRGRRPRCRTIRPLSPRRRRARAGRRDRPCRECRGRHRVGGEVDAGDSGEGAHRRPVDRHAPSGGRRGRRSRRSMCHVRHAHAGSRRRTPASRTRRVSPAARSARSPAGAPSPRHAPPAPMQRTERRCSVHRDIIADQTGAMTMLHMMALDDEAELVTAPRLARCRQRAARRRRRRRRPDPRRSPATPPVR